jgi:hypothetical protein
MPYQDTLDPYLSYTETKKFSNKWKILDFIDKCGIGCGATVVKVLVMKYIEP